MHVAQREDEQEVVLVPSPPKRRRLTYVALEDYVLPAPADDIDPIGAMRDAVCQWRESKKLAIGDFRSPTQTARGWSVVGRCMRHVSCYEGDGRYYRFLGKVHESPHVYVVSVETAGECGIEERVVRAAGGSQLGQPSVEARRKVLEAAETLLAKSCAATPTAVKLSLEPGEAGVQASGAYMQAFLQA